MDWECCWNKETLEPGECPNILADEEGGLLSSKQRRILEKCVDCALFSRDVARSSERGNALAPVLALLNQEYQHQKTQIQSLVSFLDSKTLEIRFLHELGSVLQSSMDLDEVLSVALTAITAGKGFGMNRAFLLLMDREQGLLKGHLAIGPRNIEEASQAWDEIARNDLDLKSLAQNFRLSKITSERAKFRDVLDQLIIPVSNSNHILIRALDSRHPLLVEHAFRNPDVDPDFARLLGVDTFLLMPLVSRNRRVGLIIADNFITHREITNEDLRLLETFTFTVAFAVERAALYERLQVELNRVTEAHDKLKEQQELIVRMEKMALVGRITSSIAHSIRNPLMIIGGFARSILRNTPSTDPKRDFIESIVKEARQLESVLDDILNYSDSLYPTRDFWDANQLIESTLRDMQPVLIERDCQCSFVPNPGLPLVYIDFKQLSYCVKTLIMSDMDGRSGDRISIELKGCDDSVLIVIDNQDRNISSEQLEEMLTPFSATSEMGTGIGMALCRTMLEKQGITLDVKARPQGGILYTMKLSTRKEEQA
ncbi:MAG TPA: histidine kinase dimerization/phospho-acceptor domain-containing protein [Deltaproteobacteria bacterium]|nr:histidine kinase dimerization/phospho-acceptor domain-containing protein [Deltaproteobacteria bacterium]HQB38064.1 histidine kinase dimerization/phospho-acceptor domain-containing protein [Deltaproteobacteria bacterium]